MNVFAIRYGETEWSLGGQHTGITDIALTENGRRLAHQMRPLLARNAFGLVLSSPMQRARETCELAGLGDKVVIDPGLLEWNYGDYEGLTPKEIEAVSPGWLIFRDGRPRVETPGQPVTAEPEPPSTDALAGPAAASVLISSEDSKQLLTAVKRRYRCPVLCACCSGILEDKPVPSIMMRGANHAAAKERTRNYP